jgi:hypothetical protein
MLATWYVVSTTSLLSLTSSTVFLMLTTWRSYYAAAFGSCLLKGCAVEGQALIRNQLELREKIVYCIDYSQVTKLSSSLPLSSGFLAPAVSLCNLSTLKKASSHQSFS